MVNSVAVCDHCSAGLSPAMPGVTLVLDSIL